MSSQGHQHHIVPAKTYLHILIALLILTIITVGAARINFGFFNTVIALGIASVKAALVAAFFMGLKYDERLYAVIIVTGVFLLMLLFTTSYVDFLTRTVLQSTL
jgi:cytochrome c oxidase subunit 4